MKKITLYLFVALAIVSCKKENTAPQQQHQPPKKTETLILDFKQKLENHLKDGTAYSADSAVWYVEALLNYTHGNASVVCQNFTVDTVETTVNNTGTNGFTLTQLAQVFETIESGVLAHQPVGTNIYAIDLYAYPAGNLTVFASRTAYATPRNTFKSLADTSGYWYWGIELGMCGSDSGLYVGMDATDIIEDYLNNQVQGDYFTDLETDGASYWDFYYDPNFPFNIPYLLPYRLFTALGPYQEVLLFCMPPDLIHYYCGPNGIQYIIEDLRPPRKTFAYCVVDHGATETMTMHGVTITYGIPQ